MPATHRKTTASKLRRTGHRHIFSGSPGRYQSNQASLSHQIWHLSMLHPLPHEVSQNQVLLSMHGILNQGHIPKDGTTKV